MSSDLHLIVVAVPPERTNGAERVVVANVQPWFSPSSNRPILGISGPSANGASNSLVDSLASFLSLLAIVASTSALYISRMNRDRPLGVTMTV